MSHASAPIRQPEPKLTDRRTLDCTTAVLQEHFALRAQGYVCATLDVWRVVVAAAARRSTIEATSQDLQAAPDSNTLRGYLNRAFPHDHVRAIEAMCNAALASQVPAWLRQHPVELACDLHDTPYYGRVEARDPAQPAADPDYWVCRGQRRDGTNRFYRVATAYVMARGRRWTLAVHGVHPAESDADIVQALLAQVRTLALDIACLYLDKGFASIPMLRWLKHQPLPVLLAVPLWGTDTGRGVKALCHGRCSYYTWHQFASQTYGPEVALLAMVRARLLRHRGRHHQCWAWQWMAFALINFSERPPLRQLRKRYRRRFGIESSYRLLEDARVRTTSNNPALRLVYVGVALVLQSVWIALHWLFLRVPGPGPRRSAPEHFRFDRFKRFLSRAVEAIYGVVSTLDPPPSWAKSVMY